MTKIWFISDTHYGHVNICRGVSKWIDKETSARDFQTVAKMNDAIVNSINKYVQQDHILYFLGDWSFGGQTTIYSFYERLICKNIKFIPGNHDKHIMSGVLLPTTYGWSVSGTELFEILPELITIVINKQELVLSHYPLQEWKNMDRGAFHLHGHVHHRLDNDPINVFYKRFDVGIDWEEFRPYSFEEIQSDMSRKQNKQHLS